MPWITVGRCGKLVPERMFGDSCFVLKEIVADVDRPCIQLPSIPKTTPKTFAGQ